MTHYDDADHKQRIKGVQKHYAPSDPKDPQAELREAIRKELFWITRGTLRMADNIRLNSEEDEANATFGELDAQYYRQQYGEDDGSYRTQESEDALVALFQAHQQELLSEILGELPKQADYQEIWERKKDIGMPPSDAIMQADAYNEALRDVVSAIEKYREGL